MAKKFQAADLSEVFQALLAAKYYKDDRDTPDYVKGIHVFACDGLINFRVLRPYCTSTVSLNKGVAVTTKNYFFFIEEIDLKFIKAALDRTPLEAVKIDFTVSPTGGRPVCRISIGEWFEMEAGKLLHRPHPDSVSLPPNQDPSQYDAVLSMHPFAPLVGGMGFEIKNLAKGSIVTAKNPCWFVNSIETLIY